MGTFTVTFSDVDGSALGVVASKAEAVKIKLGDVTLPEQIDPENSFYQTVALNFIHNPGNTICSMVVGGVLFKWC